MNIAWMLVIGVPLTGMILFIWPCLLIAARSDLQLEEFHKELARLDMDRDFHG